MSKAIRLLLRGEPGVEYRSAPVCFGVPFAEGELERGTSVCVTERDGTPIPTQASCLATWKKDLRHVKWLLLDFQAELDTSGERELLLVTGGDAAPPAPASQVRITRQDGLLVLDTGPMRLELYTSFEPWLRPARRSPFARCLVRTAGGMHDVFGGGAPLLSIRDQHGRTYRSDWGPAPVVEVEEAGPVRACVKISGHHALEGGPHAFPYVLRLHVYAGKADITLRHTFVFDQEPERVELTSIRVDLPLALGESVRAAVGGESAPHFAASFRSLHFLQTDDSSYAVSRDGAAFGSGRKNRGWASLSGTHVSALAVIRNCWQEYPKGLELAADGLGVEIWPAEAPQRLSFTTPWKEPVLFLDGRPKELKPIRDEAAIARLLREHPTAPINLKSAAVKDMAELEWMERLLAKHAPDRPASYNDTGTSDGTGAAKTTDIVLRFSGERVSDEDAERFALSVQHPLIAPADPAHSCATGALGQLYHAGDSRFAEVDQALDDVLERIVVEPRVSCRFYGMMRYGNVLCGHGRAGPGLAYLYYKDRDPSMVQKRVGLFNNEANDLIMGVWANFARTGRRDHFLLARDYGLSVADVATVHAHPREPGHVGLMHYHNAHQWTGGPSASHTLLSGLLCGYYFGGDRRILDVACEAADRAVRTQEPAGVLSCRHGTLHREFTGPLWSLMEAYRATWREEYGELASRSFAWFMRTIPEPGLYPNSVFTRGARGDEAVVQPPCSPPQSATEKYYLFRMARELFPSRALEKQIVADADYWLWRGNESDWSWYASMAALAYEITGDLTYAAYCRARIEHFLKGVAPIRAREHVNFGAIGDGSVVPRFVRVAVEALSRDPAGLDRAEKAWLEKRRTMPTPADPARPDQGPERSLGVLSTERLP